MSLIAHRQIMFSDDKYPWKETPVFWYDGLWNAGIGSHSNYTNTWVNLGSAGSNYNGQRWGNSGTTMSYWGSNYANFPTRRNGTEIFLCDTLYPGRGLSLLGSNTTIGATFSVDSGWRYNYSGLLGNHARWSNGVDVGLCFMQYQTSNVGFGILYRTNEQYAVFDSNSISPSTFTNNTVYNVMMVTNTNESKLYLNGNLYKNVTYNCNDPFKISPNTELTIGGCCNSNSGSTDRGFVGNCYGVYCFDYNLDENEIKKLSSWALERSNN